MKQRHLLSLLINTFCEKAVGVEIGVDHAETTVYLLDNCSDLCHLYAVDPYVERNERYNLVSETLSGYDNCTLLRMTSDAAASSIPNDLDFIFIDGDHSFLGVQLDLVNYVPKLKPGGLLTGHDWTCVRKDFGVVQACEEFFNDNDTLFQPLFSNEELVAKNLGDFKRGGWSEKSKRHLIHKKRPSAFPLWWLVKR